MKNKIYILGIESSCDETAASIIQTDKKNKQLKVLSNIISSQIEIHKKYGGVIPEIAAREHVLNILPVIDEALKKANITENELNAIGVTTGPGLITSLISGLETAKSLATVWKKPLISVNHIEGHIYANFIENNQNIKFPAIILTVSGGHTILLKMTKHKKITILGETRDDAAGEAYDKAAKMLNLGYPGGPIISQLADEYAINIEKKHKYLSIKLPRPMINSKNEDFSFSGLKTALLYELKKDTDWQKHVSAYAYSFQEAVVETLVKKTINAALKFKAKSIMLAGGVSANKCLRETLAKEVNKKFNNEVDFYCPNLMYTTDNAAMIASATCFKFAKKEYTDISTITANPNLELK